MAVSLHFDLVRNKHMATQQSGKISIALINNPPGKYCLVHLSAHRRDDSPEYSAGLVNAHHGLSRFLLCPVNVSPVGCLVPRRRQRRLSQSN
jgi:hypothetical protein